MNNEMRRLLEPLCGEDAIVSVYCDNRNSDTFFLGYLLDMDDDDLLLNLLSPGGEEDGYAVICQDIIFTAGEDRPYGAKILKLSLLKGQKKKPLPTARAEGSALYDLLAYAYAQQAVVWINFDRNLTGVVENYTDDSLTLVQVDEFGKEYGRTVIDTDAVMLLRCRTAELRDIELLRRAEKAGLGGIFIERGN